MYTSVIVGGLAAMFVNPIFASTAWHSLKCYNVGDNMHIYIHALDIELLMLLAF